MVAGLNYPDKRAGRICTKAVVFRPIIPPEIGVMPTGGRHKKTALTGAGTAYRNSAIIIRLAGGWAQDGHAAPESAMDCRLRVLRSCGFAAQRCLIRSAIQAWTSDASQAAVRWPTLIGWGKSGVA